MLKDVDHEDENDTIEGEDNGVVFGDDHVMNITDILFKRYQHSRGRGFPHRGRGQQLGNGNSDNEKT